ncbi:hypothetical protein JCM5296_006595, partial [Sporobolomyces johnsonii]
EAGPRVHSLSSPLASRGISILFLSTFYSDYILVRSSSLTRVTEILEESGFVFGEADEDDEEGMESLRDSLELEERAGGSRTASRRGSGEDDRRAMGARERAGSGGATLSRSMSMSGSVSVSRPSHGAPPLRSNSMSATTAAPPHALSPSTSPPRAGPSTSASPAFTPPLGDPFSPFSLPLPSPSTTPTPSSFSPLPLSPTSATTTTHPPSPHPQPPPPRDSLTLLPDALICIGLSLEPAHQDVWRTKIVEMLFFPSCLHSRSPDSSFSPAESSPRRRRRRRHRSGSGKRTGTRRGKAGPTPFVALTQTPEGASLTADVELLRTSFLGGRGRGESTDGRDELVFTVGSGGLGGLWDGEAEEADSGEEEEEGEHLEHDAPEEHEHDHDDPDDDD